MLLVDARTEGLLGKEGSSQLRLVFPGQKVGRSLHILPQCAELFMAFIRGRGLCVHTGEGSPVILALVN